MLYGIKIPSDKTTTTEQLQHSHIINAIIIIIAITIIINSSYTITNTNDAISSPRNVKQRKKKPIDKKINGLIIKLKTELGSLRLANVFVIDDNNMDWWYCTTCVEAKGNKNL